MGLLSRVRERVKDRALDTARRIVDKARDTIDDRLGLPTQRGDDPSAGSGPTFREAGDRGLEGWEAARPLLQQVGIGTGGLLQARFTDSELVLRDRLDRLEGLVKSGDGAVGRWREATEQLAVGWQEQNSRIIEAWRSSFEVLDRAWGDAGSRVQSLPWKKAWGDAAAAFDTVWLSEWERFQGVLEEVCGSLKGLFNEVAARADLSPAVSQSVWQRALSLVDGGIRRAHGDLWGAWGTQGALMRGCARKILEEQGLPAQIYPPAFTRSEEDFARAIRLNVQDIRDSWTAAIDLLIQELERRA